MSLADAPVTRDRIVARALGVSHASVYRHVATKAELRDLVVGRWAEATMPPLRAIAALRIRSRNGYDSSSTP